MFSAARSSWSVADGQRRRTHQLGRLFGEWIKFIWVNKPENLLFALKDAVASGGSSLAMQCDRLEFTAGATEYFQFRKPA